MELVSFQIPRPQSDRTPIVIAPIGDIQWSGKRGSTATDTLKRHIDRCLELNAYYVGLGDYIDFASPSNRQRLRAAALYDSAEDVIDDAALDLVQEVFDLFLRPTKGRYLGMVHGHHYANLKTGETTDQRLCQLLDARFLGTSGFIRLQFVRPPNQKGNVVMFVHHGCGGGMKAASPLNKIENLAPYWDADMFLLGHSTKMATAPINRVSARWSGHGAPELIHRKIMMIGCGGFSKSYIQGAKQGRVPMGCVPLSTKILTRRGFIHHTNLIPGESVAVYEKQSLRWGTLHGINVYDGDVDVYGLKVGGKGKNSPGLIWSTADHRWIIRDSKYRKDSEITTGDVKTFRHHGLVSSAPMPDDPGVTDITPLEAEILGWIVTDGWFYPWARQCGIGQKKEPYRSYLRNLLKDCSTEYVTEIGHSNFMLPIWFVETLFARADVKSETFDGLPELVCRISSECRLAMRKAFDFAESSRTARGWRFHQIRSTVLEAWEILNTLEGNRLGKRCKRQSGLYSRRSLGRNLVYTKNQTKPSKTVSGVWCPSTDAGTWVMMQDDGAITITGNSYVEQRLLNPASLGAPLIYIRPNFHTIPSSNKPNSRSTSRVWDYSVSVEV